MIERGLNGRMDGLKTCLKEQMNGSDREQWHGLLQKKTAEKRRWAEDSDECTPLDHFSRSMLFRFYCRYGKF